MLRGFFIKYLKMKKFYTSIHKKARLTAKKWVSQASANALRVNANGSKPGVNLWKEDACDLIANANTSRPHAYDSTARARDQILLAYDQIRRANNQILHACDGIPR